MVRFFGKICANIYIAHLEVLVVINRTISFFSDFGAFICVLISYLMFTIRQGIKSLKTAKNRYEGRQRLLRKIEREKKVMQTRYISSGKWKL